MFENLQRKLQQLNNLSIAVPLQADENGFLDRECPAKQCLFRFKVFGDHWNRLSKQANVSCPMCGHKAPPDQWATTDQVEQAKANALKSIHGQINSALRDAASDFNRSQRRGGLITMSMSVSGGHTSEVVLPIEAAQAMSLEIECEQCKTKFAVVGSAFFCPGCGHSSAERMFKDALRKMDVKLSYADIARQAIEQQASPDAAALAHRSMIESCLPDGVVAFQRYCDALYAKLSNVKAPPTNVFQRLNDGSQLWKAATGQGYEDWLTLTELATLSLQFQRRHLLAHSEGIVDAKYLSNTGDTSYVSGQRLVIQPADVRAFEVSLSKLADKIRQAVAALTP